MSDTFFYMVSVNSMPSIKSILYAAVSILIVICGFNFYSRKILIEIIPEHFWHKKINGTHYYHYCLEIFVLFWLN